MTDEKKTDEKKKKLDDFFKEINSFFKDAKDAAKNKKEIEITNDKVENLFKTLSADNYALILIDGNKVHTQNKGFPIYLFDDGCKFMTNSSQPGVLMHETITVDQNSVKYFVLSNQKLDETKLADTKKNSKNILAWSISEYDAKKIDFLLLSNSEFYNNFTVLELKGIMNQYEDKIDIN